MSADLLATSLRLNTDLQNEITQLRAQVARLKATNAALVRDLRREMERNDFREAIGRVVAVLGTDDNGEMP